MGGRGRRARWVAGCCTMAVLAATVGAAGAAPAHARGPEPVVYTVVGTPHATRARLAATASILQRRLRALGATHAAVRVRRHRLLATHTANVAASDDPVARPGRLELRPVLQILPPSPGGPDPSDDQYPIVLSLRQGSDSTPGIRYAVGAPELTNRDVHMVRAYLSPGGPGWTIDLGLNDRGQAAFNRMAGALYPRQPPQNAVALVVDGVVQSAPAFQTDSFSGDVSISGGFTHEQARKLAVALRYGALPLHLRRFTPTR